MGMVGDSKKQKSIPNAQNGADKPTFSKEEPLTDGTSETRYRRFLEQLPDMVYEMQIFRRDLAPDEKEAVLAAVRRLQSAQEDDLDTVIAETAPQLIPFISGAILYSNETASQVLGHSLDRLGEITMAELIPPEHLQHALHESLKILAHGKLSHSEYDLLAADGRRLPVSIHANLKTKEFPFIAHGVARDITVRRKFEEALERVNACFLAFGPDIDKNISSITNLAGELFGANTALYNRLEEDRIVSRAQWNPPPDYVSSDTAEGHICSDIARHVHPNKTVTLRNLLESRYAETDPNVRKYGLQTYFGHPIKCQGVTIGSLCVVYQKDVEPCDHDKKIMGILAAAISSEEERRHARAALVASEQNYRRIFTEVNDEILFLSSDGVILEVNPRITDIFGYLPEEVLGKKFIDVPFFKPQELSRLVEKFTQVASSGSRELVAAQALHKDGSDIYVEASARLVENGPEGVLVVLRDVTERRNVEAALIESEEKYRELADSLPQMLFETDAQGKVTFTNARGFEVFGYNQTDLEKGIYIPQAIVEEDHQKLQRNIMDILGGKKTAGNEYTARRKDGSTLPVAIYSTPIVTENEVTGIRGIVIDITERKELEAERRQLQEEHQRREKMEAIGRLAGGNAHDFNNLLSGMTINASLAAVQSDEVANTLSAALVLVKDDPDLHDLVEQAIGKMRDIGPSLQDAERAAKRAARMNNRLLTFSSIGVPVKETTSLAEVITDTVELVLGKHSSARAACRISNDLYSVEVDAGQITQVIYSVVLNAKEAMEDGGEILISAENVRFDPDNRFELAEGDYVRLRVQDSGCGIPEDVFPKIFDPYFSTKINGNGLGLSTSYSIVEKHNGRMFVDSEESKGTTVDVYLPASDKPAHSTQPPSPRSGRILLMDDEEVVRLGAGRLFTYVGHDYCSVNDGEEAIRQYVEALQSNSPFDVVILDITVPGGMGGIEAARKIREHKPDAKIVASSGYPMGSIMKGPEGRLFDGFLPKPYNKNEVDKLLRKLFAENGPHK